jgi:hypothetical protein
VSLCKKLQEKAHMFAAVAVLLLQVALPKAMSVDVPSTDKTGAQIVQVDDSSRALPAAVTPRTTTATDGGNSPSTATPANPLAGINIPQRAPVLTGFRAGPDEVVRTNRPWLALSLVQHGAATFDAWSTRRAISQGRLETDPLLKPFASSSALYGAMQIGPGLLDIVSHRMYRSQKSWVRKLWWVPQAAATVGFVFAGSSNMAHTH